MKTDKSFSSNLEIGSKVANITSYVLIGRIINFIFLGIALVLVTRLLGPAQYGIYTLAVAFAGIFGSVGYLGIGTSLNKFIPEFVQKKKYEEINQIVSNALFLIIVTGVVFTIACFFLSSLISSYIFQTSSLSYVVQLVSFWIISSMLFGVFYDALVGFGDGKNIAIAAGIQAIAQSVISIFFALQGYGAVAPILGLVFGYLFAAAFGIWIVFKLNNISFRLPSTKYIKKLWGFSFPLAVSSILSGVVGNIALIFLGSLGAGSIIFIGNIGVASRTGSLINVIFDSLGFAILPTFSAIIAHKELQKEAGRIYSYLVYLSIVIVSPILFEIIILSAPFSYAIFGSQYIYAPLYISILSLGLLLGIAGTYASTLLIGSGKVNMVLKYNIIAYLLVLLLFFILIPILQGLGYVLVSFLAIPLILDIIFISRLRTLFKINFRINKLLRIIVANVITSGMVLLLTLVSGGLVLLVSSFIAYMIIYPIFAVLLGGIEKADISTIRSISKGIPFVGKVLMLFIDYVSMVIR